MRTLLVTIAAAAALGLPAHAHACDVPPPPGFIVHGTRDDPSLPVPSILAHHVRRGYTAASNPTPRVGLIDSCGGFRAGEAHGRIRLDVDVVRADPDLGVQIEVLGSPSPRELAGIRPDDWVSRQPELRWSSSLDDDIPIDVTLRLRAVHRTGGAGPWSEPHRIRDEGGYGCFAARTAAGLPALALVLLALLVHRCSATPRQPSPSPSSQASSQARTSPSRQMLRAACRPRSR